MGKWCLHAGLFIFDRIIIKVAGNQDRHKSSVEFDFGPNQTTHFGVTCPWVTEIPHFWTWISLKPVGQSWSNFMCSIIGVGERLHKVLGQIDLGTLDSGERSLPFGLLVFKSDSLIVVICCWIDQTQENDREHFFYNKDMKRDWYHDFVISFLFAPKCKDFVTVKLLKSASSLHHVMQHIQV